MLGIQISRNFQQVQILRHQSITHMHINTEPRSEGGALITDTLVHSWVGVELLAGRQSDLIIGKITQ